LLLVHSVCLRLRLMRYTIKLVVNTFSDSLEPPPLAPTRDYLLHDMNDATRQLIGTKKRTKISST